MKKHILSIMLFCATLSINAQEYLHINSHWYEGYIPVELIDSITYGEPQHQQMLPAIMAKDPNISIFNKALEITHMGDSLLGRYNYNYRYEKSIILSFQQLRFPAMHTIKKGYTAFAETDSVYAAHGINNIEDLKAYAARIYNEMYPEDAGITDPTDRRNSLNRFVSYHLLEIKANKNNLTAANITTTQNRPMKQLYVPGYNISDWYETMMPHSLMKCTTPYNQNTVFINRCDSLDPLRGDGTVEGAEIISASEYGQQGEALNGYYHYLNDIIAYDKQTQQVVLNEQIIVNNSTMSPEFFNNDLRINHPASLKIVGAYEHGVYFPEEALKNIKCNNSASRIHYLFNDGWQDYQTDEMIITGSFDITIKLPSLPAGTYELSLGHNAYALRPIVAAYFDGEFCDTLDTRNESSGNIIGWESDERLGTPEAIAQNDSLLFSNGYRKGLNYYLAGDHSGRTTMRNGNTTLRRIITTFTTDGKSDHYLRLRDTTGNYINEFHIDYLELTPTRLLKEYK